MAQLLTERFELTAEDLKSRIKEGHSVFLVNLRHHGDWDVALYNARGALRIADDEVGKHLDEIPRDREVVICYSGPGDGPSISAAQLLQQKGWHDVHPLKGGFKAYLEAGLPVEELGHSIAKEKMLLGGS